MGSMIYYPGFELKDEKWLKYALLYFDELRPIIPHIPISKEKYFSPSALKVMDETNLIRPYYPDYGDGQVASALACEEFDRLIQHPEFYPELFHRSNPNDLRTIWTNPRNHSCKLYYGKFSDSFFKYCLEDKIATEFRYGIRLDNQLAFIYMSFLADVISKKEQIEMFTDESRYNLLLKKNDIMLSKQIDLEIKILKAQIETPFPQKTKNIPLDDFIKLRTDKSFNECRIEFAKQMDAYIKKKENNPNLEFDQLFSPTKDIVNILGTALGVLGTTYLTVSSFVSLGESPTSLPLALATACSSILTIKELNNTPKFFAKMRSKVQARRYLARVKNLYDTKKRR